MSPYSTMRGTLPLLIMDKIFFDGWFPLIRTLIIGLLAYTTLILFLRISGRRTLAKMNAFDLVVTVSLGSTLASILISKDVALAQGAVALALLIGLQFLITWTSVRARWIRRLVTGEPALLFFRGEFISEAMRRARVTEDEVRAAMRFSGVAKVDSVEAVVLETDGSFSVLRGSSTPGNTSLADVRIPGRD